ncbi:MAG TPA: arginine deiminase-related protein [Puia sp.]|nr:arginine deiminase-related protein [Puia sp.]
MQITAHLLMIRPVHFAFNAETAVNNAFQVPGENGDVHARALHEFDELVSLLRNNDVDVTVIDDRPEPFTPDSIFPNNWISFHHNGTICLYPMFAVNRRLERDPGIIRQLTQRFKVHKSIDFSFYENDKHFLEGTGSMVLDRDDRIAYACLSPRTDEKVLKDFGKTMGYKCVSFNAVDGNDQAIYHTNVMMCVGEKYVVININSIHSKEERERVVATIRDSGKDLITISDDQMNHFAGNMLQIKNISGDKLLVMSTQAYQSLQPDQIKKLSRYNKIIHSALDTIECNGGGSARCMIAEIHLPQKE